MKLRTVLLSALSFVLLAATPIFSLDWGGVIDNSTELLVSDKTEFDQQDKLSLWMDAALGERWSFSAQGSYTYELDRPYLFDVDSLQFEGRFPNVEKGPTLFTVTLGRFSFSDFTGLVLDHRADGFALGFNYPNSIFTVALGYTGLLLKPTSTIRVSLTDASEDNDDSVVLAPPRAVGALKAVFPELLGRQDLTLSLLFQQDLHSKDDLVAEGQTTPDYNKGGQLNTQYLGFGFSGPLSSSLYYDAFVYGGMGRTLSYIDGAYKYETILAALGGVGVRYYLEQALSSRVGFRFLYASGDEDSDRPYEGNTGGLATAFLPISKPELGLIFQPQLSNLFLAELSYSLKPLAWMQVQLKAVPFFRSTPAPIQESGIDPSSDALYLGTEVDGAINIRPFSDLGLGFSAGLFLPNSGTNGALPDRALEVKGKLDFSFSF